MNIIIYGIGAQCGRILKTIKKYPDLNVIGLADTYKEENPWGIPMIEIGKCDNEYEDVPIIISISNPYQVLRIYFRLKKSGYKRIYRYLNKTYSWRDNFLQGECEKLEGVGEYWLPRLEMHVANHCNLNCKCCTHYSPLFGNHLPDFGRNMADAAKLNELTGGVLELNLLGGEPFLNTGIPDYVNKIREYLHVVNIFVITNGLLIPMLEDRVLECFHDNHVIVSVSVYEPTYHMVDRIKEKLEAFQVDYRLGEYGAKSKFFKTLSLSGESEYPRGCISDLCVNVANGKIARCPTLLYLEKLNNRFGLNLPAEGIFRLDEFKDGADLLQRLSEQVPLCGYCIKKEVPWSQCGRELKAEDFVEME